MSANTISENDDIHETAAWRAPAIPDNDELIYDEPGRVLVLEPTNVCFSAYHFRVSKRFSIAMMHVKHGGGQESYSLPYGMLQALSNMDSDTRFLTLHSLMDAHHKSAKCAAQRTASQYAQAFTEDRLKRRKVRGMASIKVWIEPAKEQHAMKE